MKIEKFIPRTSEHKAFLSHFLAPLTVFIVVVGVIVYWFN